MRAFILEVILRQLQFQNIKTFNILEPEEKDKAARGFVRGFHLVHNDKYSQKQHYLHNKI